MVSSRKSSGKGSKDSAAAAEGPSSLPAAAGKKAPVARRVNPVHVTAGAAYDRSDSGERRDSGRASPMEAGLPSPQQQQQQQQQPSAQPPPSGRGRDAGGRAAAGRRPWWRAVPGLPYFLLALSLLGAFLLGAKLGSVPMQQLGDLYGSAPGGTQQQRQRRQQQPGEKVAAEASGPFPRGCKWREVYNKVRALAAAAAVRGAAGCSACIAGPAC